MASPRESVEQRRDAIPGRVTVVARVPRCQSIKCPYTGAGAWTKCVQVPSSGTDLVEGALSPRARRTLLEGRSAVPPWRAVGGTRVVIVSCVCFRFVG
jgi:hypothetical protein